MIDGLLAEKFGYFEVVSKETTITAYKPW